MNAAEVAFVGPLSYRFPVLTETFAEHLADQDGEVLPHVFMGDVTRWLLERLRVHGPKDATLREILGFLEEWFTRRNGRVDELLAVSFLENLPRSPEPGSELRSLLGPALREELRRLGV